MILNLANKVRNSAWKDKAASPENRSLVYARKFSAPPRNIA